MERLQILIVQFSYCCAGVCILKDCKSSGSMLTDSPGFCSHYFRDALKNGKIVLEWAVIERSANAPIPSRRCAGEHVPLFVWLAIREKSPGAPCTCSVPATNPSVLGTKKSTMWQKKKEEGRKIERKWCSWSTKLFSLHTFSLCFLVFWRSFSKRMQLGGGWGGMDVLPGVLSLDCRVLESEVYLESAEARLPTPPNALPFHSCTHTHAAHPWTHAIESQRTVCRPTGVNTSK